MRTARATPLCLSDRGTHGLLQLHRRLLQSHPAALRPGVSLAHSLRTGDANRAAIRQPLNRPPNRGNFNGRLVFGIFAALAEFEHALIVERTQAGHASAWARGRNGGRPFKMTVAKLRLAQVAMGKPGTKVGELCAELSITRQTLYRHVDPNGLLRPDGEKLFGRMKTRSATALSR